MKKVLISATLPIGMIASAMVFSSFTTPKLNQMSNASLLLNETIAIGKTNITVYKLIPIRGTSTYSKVTVNAEVDKKEMKLYVQETREGRTLVFDYYIRKNPAYGQSDDYRGSYMYTAGDYYFNL